MMFRERLPAVNIVYASGKTLDTLVSADTLDYDEILGLGAQSETFGRLPGADGHEQERPADLQERGGRDERCVVSLDQDSAFRSILATTRSEEDAKTIFDGGYTNIKGHIIKEYQPIDHDGVGAIGSPLNPKAVLGVAITAGTARSTSRAVATRRRRRKRTSCSSSISRTTPTRSW
jgi:hypothetical protein